MNLYLYVHTHMVRAMVPWEGHTPHWSHVAPTWADLLAHPDVQQRLEAAQWITIARVDR